MKSRREEDVLNILKKKGRLSTTSFVKLLGLHFYHVKMILDSLESQGRIKKDKKGSYIYWSIKNG